MVLKFLEYISYIKIKKSGPSSRSLLEKKCILLSVVVVASEMAMVMKATESAEATAMVVASKGMKVRAMVAA